MTVYRSGHKTKQFEDYDMTIDRCVDVSEGGDEDVCNFHVINEIYTAGRISGKSSSAGGSKQHWAAKYDGWAAVDTTAEIGPRTKFGCGPSPVKAIKEGTVNEGYDTLYFYQEINADVITTVGGQVIDRIVDDLGENIFTYRAGFMFHLTHRGIHVVNVTHGLLSQKAFGLPFLMIS